MIVKNSDKASILIIYTGGTIGMIKDYKTKSLKAFNFIEIKNKLPELEQLNCNIETISFDNPIDSSDMSIEYYYKLADIINVNYKVYDGFVVLSGTDTMSYVASAISFMFENLKKPIIFTGSQLPIGDLRTDAKENLITSIEIAATQYEDKPLVQEVGLYFEYKLFRANRTTKISTNQFEAFSSRNFPILAQSGVVLKFNKDLLFRSKGTSELVLTKRLDPNIVVLRIFPGIAENVIDSILNIDGLKGVILQTYGSGNAPTQKWFINKLTAALQKGIYIVNVTQCIEGEVIMGMYESSIDLKNNGVINGKDITLESAVAKMIYLLGKKLTKKEFKKYFESSLRGEID